MFNLNFKKIGIISLLLLFVSMSCVCSQDVGVNSTSSDISDLNQENSIVVSGSFSELNDDLSNLSSGDTYNFNKDYYYDSAVDGAFVDGICINASNVEINGNNHFISGNNISSIFKVYGDNVKIFNLNFVDSNGIRESIIDSEGFDNYIAAKMGNALNWEYWPPSLRNYYAIVENQAKELFGGYVGSSSPVTWYGNNGVISNCVFMSNAAINGGALTWKGNNGTVRNVDFINNTARGIGGSIYVVGNNTTVEDCNFVNSFSNMSFEPIFFDYKSAGSTITGNISVSDNEVLAYDCVSKFDPDCFYKPVIYEIYSNVYINLVEYAYRSWVLAGYYFDENDFSYYGVKSDNDFQLNFDKFYKYYDKNSVSYKSDREIQIDVLNGDFSHLRVFNFNNITCLDDVINSLYAGNYAIEDVVLANYTFYGKDLSTLNTLSFKDDIFGSIVPQNVTYVLNINLPSGRTYDFNGQLNLPKQYDVVNIIGNGVKIAADSGLRDENHLLVLDDDQVYTFNNLTISGFNTALRLNNGICILNNVVFDSNKLDYRIDKDWGGAILNAAVCFCYNCTFINNLAQNGGAIFNCGVLCVDNATVFDNNYAKSNGNTILNVDEGLVYIDNVQINGTTDIVRYVSSFSTLDNVFIALGAMAASSFVGLLAGLVGGPNVGIALGIIGGAGIGYLAYNYIDTHNFDLHFNRLLWAGICIGGSMVAGGIGGYIGGKIHGPNVDPHAQAAAEHEAMLSGAQFLEDGRVLDCNGNFIGTYINVENFQAQHIGFTDGYILIRSIPALPVP